MKHSAGLVGGLLLLSFAACGRGTHNPKPDDVTSMAGTSSSDEPQAGAGDDAGQGGKAAVEPPVNACARRTRNCCSPTGQSDYPECAADGSIGECPAGYAVTTGTCLPAGVDIESCAELESGMACTDPKLVCFTSKCGRNCSCAADEDGKLAWECHALPC